MSDPRRHERLRLRAELLAKLRAFFTDRGFLEVETPLLDSEIIPELHIEPFGVLANRGDSARSLWLQASPELHMKRLLCEGLPAIFQVTRSFRRGERGLLHNPEFTMVEWYRVGDGMGAGMRMLESLCGEVAGSQEPVRTSYRESFLEHVGLDPHSASGEELRDAARRLQVAVPDLFTDANRDEWLNLLLAAVVEPRLGASAPEILYDYPASQSALAETIVHDGVEVGERFELYWRGVELANGYHELTDARRLRRRLEEVNVNRAAAGRPALPLPERMLAEMSDPGLPSCTGCALGFDRLAMLSCGASSIDDVIAFPWNG
jgi:elongation factor P--(R)-beta-lysine ligase